MKLKILLIVLTICISLLVTKEYGQSAWRQLEDRLQLDKLGQPLPHPTEEQPVKNVVQPVQRDTPTRTESEVVQEIENILHHARFNGTALVVKQGKVLLNKGYGYADFGQKIENSPSTKFWIGSITKMSIATAILQLQEAGKLNIADTVHKYIPSFPADKQIQLRHLLTHTSGLPDQGAKRWVFSTHLSYVTWIGQQPLSSIPGGTWRYSDYNYVVLAYIAEKVAGEPIEQYIQKHIFTPAGMTESGFSKSYFQTAGQSKGYKRIGDDLKELSDLYFPSLFGCGDMYTTTHDLYKLDQALMNGILLSQNSLQQMMTPGSDSTYGFGFYISPDKTLYNHGLIAGWDTFNTFNWDKKVYVILFSNIQGVHRNVSNGIWDLTVSAVLDQL